MIDIKLKTFYSLVKTKNMTLTAKMLNMTQPGVSKHIKFLEEKLNTKLIELVGKKIIITKAGYLLETGIYQMIVLENKIYQKINEANSKTKIYKVGATKTIGAYLVSDLMKNYMEEYKCNIILTVDNTNEILKKLNKKEIELALVEGVFNFDDYNTSEIMDDRLVYVTSMENKIDTNKSLEEILEDVIILREEGSGTRKLLENRLADHNLDIKSFKNYMEIGDITAIKDLISKDMGSSFISKLAVKEEVKNNKLKIQDISNFKIERKLYYVWCKGENTNFIDTFIDHNEMLLSDYK